MNSLICQGSVFYQNKEWFVCTESDRVYQKDLSTGIVDILCVIPRRGKNSERPYGGICYFDDQIIVYPYCSNILWIYNLKNSNFTQVKVSNEEEFLYISTAFIESNYLYMLSYGKNKILKFDLYSKLLKVYNIPNIKNGEGAYSDAKLIKGKIYMLVNNRPWIIAFDLEECTFDIYNIKCELDGLYTIEFDGRYFWVTGKGDKLIKWDRSTNQVVESFEFPDYMECFLYRNEELIWIKGKDLKKNHIFPFYRSLIIKYKLVLIPFTANYILAFDIKEKKYIIINIDNQEENFRDLSGIYPGWLGHKYLIEGVDFEEKLYLYSLRRRLSYIIDLDMLEVRENIWNQDGRYNYEDLQEYYIENGYQNILLDYMKFILLANRTKGSLNDMEIEKVVGTKIYREVRKI